MFIAFGSGVVLFAWFVWLLVVVWVFAVYYCLVVWRVAVSLFDLFGFVLWVFDADVNSVVVLRDVFSFGVWWVLYI